MNFGGDLSIVSRFLINGPRHVFAEVTVEPSDRAGRQHRWSDVYRISDQGRPFARSLTIGPGKPMTAYPAGPDGTPTTIRTINRPGSPTTK
jgi:hypothetical protein